MNEIAISSKKQYDVNITYHAMFNHTLTVEAFSSEEAGDIANDFISTNEFDKLVQNLDNYDMGELEIEVEPDEEDNMNENSFSLKNLAQEGMFVDPAFAKIPGDETKRKTPKDVMEKHNVGIDTLKQKLKKGIKVETEHSTNTMIAAQIALVHLYEDINYYENNPNIEESNSMNCPKCGGKMTQGVNHAGKGLQWECHNCGNIIQPYKEELSGQISKWIKKGDIHQNTPKPPIQKKKVNKSVKEITVNKETNLYNDIKKYHDSRYSFYSHSLPDSEINDVIKKSLESPRCPKETSEIIPWVAFQIDDYIISNGKADDIQP